MNAFLFTELQYALVPEEAVHFNLQIAHASKQNPQPAIGYLSIILLLFSHVGHNGSVIVKVVPCQASLVKGRFDNMVQ